MLICGRFFFDRATFCSTTSAPVSSSAIRVWCCSGFRGRRPDVTPVTPATPKEKEPAPPSTSTSCVSFKFQIKWRLVGRRIRVNRWPSVRFSNWRKMAPSWWMCWRQCVHYSIGRNEGNSVDINIFGEMFGANHEKNCIRQRLKLLLRERWEASSNQITPNFEISLINSRHFA